MTDDSAYTSGNIDTTRVVVQTILNISQDISQGVTSQQLINVNCGKKSDTCNKCIMTAKKYGLGTGDYSDICGICFCTLENVNLSNIITVDFEALQLSTQENFNQQIVNSITQQLASQKKYYNSSAGGKDPLTLLNDSSKNVWKAVQDNSFMESLQELKAFQVVSLENPNTSLINVDMELAINFISNILQSNKETSSAIDTLNSQIIQISNQSSMSIFYFIINWIVKLIIIGAVIMLSIFMFNFTMTSLALFAST